jgi:hypothetical protein
LSYKVEWSEKALNDLATIWVNADNNARPAINRAAVDIDKLLETKADQVGESRDGDQRVFFLPPLIFSFGVYEITGAVLILGVRPLTRRK